jgi:hypothetical protein
MHGRTLQLARADRRQREVADRPAPFPALEARLRKDALRARARVEVGQRRQPVDAIETVTMLAARFGVEEVLC